MRSELIHLKERCPNTQIAMLTSLAAGGDLLCADVAEELGIPVFAALPMEPSEYRGGTSASRTLPDLTDTVLGRNVSASRRTCAMREARCR